MMELCMLDFHKQDFMPLRQQFLFRRATVNTIGLPPCLIHHVRCCGASQHSGTFLDSCFRVAQFAVRGTPKLSTKSCVAFAPGLPSLAGKLQSAGWESMCFDWSHPSFAWTRRVKPTRRQKPLLRSRRFVTALCRPAGCSVPAMRTAALGVQLESPQAHQCSEFR